MEHRDIVFRVEDALQEVIELEGAICTARQVRLAALAVATALVLPGTSRANFAATIVAGEPTITRKTAPFTATSPGDADCAKDGHVKCYSPHVLCSNPPQYQWICRKCGEEGADRGAYCDSGDYEELLRKKGERDA